MINKLFKRTMFLAVLALIVTMMFGMTVLATDEVVKNVGNIALVYSNNNLTNFTTDITNDEIAGRIGTEYSFYSQPKSNLPSGVYNETLTITGTDVEDSTITEYDLWVGNTQVTSANASNVLEDEKISYDATTNTLTLNGATITGAGDENHGYGIKYQGNTDLTVVANGTNTILDNTSRKQSSAGILLGGTIGVYNGDGFTRSEYRANLIITLNEGATLNVNAGEAIAGTYPQSCGICIWQEVGNVTINGSGTLNVKGGNSNYSYGINVPGTAMFSSTGNSTISTTDGSYFNNGIYAQKKIIFNSGNVTVTGGNSTDGQSYAILTDSDWDSSGGKEVIINGGTINLSGGNAPFSYGISVGNTIQINGGTLEVKVLGTGDTAKVIDLVPTLASGLLAGASKNADGSNPVKYKSSDNNLYKWYKVPIDPSLLTYTIGINAVDKADSEALEYAKISLLKNNSAIDSWTSTTSVHQISGLEVGEYTLKVTEAPEGYLTPSDITFTIASDGTITTTETTTTDESGNKTFIFEFVKTKIEVKAVKKADSSALANVKIQILDSESTVRESWTSTTENHSVEGLIAGKEYTIKVTEVPTGYEIPENITFTIATDGKVTSTGDMTNDNDSNTVKLRVPAPTTYTVSFDANGGSGSMTAATGVSGSYALPACTFTAPSGKQFKAWQVGTDPTERAVGYSITVTDNVTVKAIWEDSPVVKVDQTITAADVSATYGDTGKKITVTSTNYGALSYAVKSGTSASVDASGNLTINGAGNTVITITAAGDATHNSATKDVTISVAKATVTVAAKNQSIYVNGTVPNLSSPVKDTHYTVTGLVGSDTLTGTLALAYEKDGSLATPDNTTAGTYDIVVSGVDVPNTTNYNAIVLTKGTLTISTKPSGGGGTPTVTVPISGDAGSVNVKVSVSGTTASVDTVTAADLSKVVDAATEPVNVVIDMTGLGKTIDAATLTNSTLKAIADAANEPGSGITGLEVKLSGGTVILEDKSLGVIQEKAGSDSVTIAVKSAAVADLNAKQKPVVEKLNAPALFDVYFLVGSKRVESLNGSKIKITVPYVLTKGTAVVYYVDDAGKLEKLACTYDAAAKTVSFETTHNSYYIVSADDDPCVNFTDINRDLWYHEAIDYALENSLMNGEGGGKFNPSGNLSRAMLCQIFYNKEGRPAVTGANPFTDVPAGQWYTDAVIWAYENKIVEGYDNGKFGPNDDITREQLAAIIWRYDGKKASAASLDAFSDAGKISSYALDALKWAVENKVVSGKGNGILDPRGKATRAEVAQMLMNYLKK